MKALNIATRGSDLALWQAHYLQDQLKAIGIESALNIIKTRGDNIQHLGFDKMEGKGFFTKEIEDALLDKSCDIAVHSMKDLPTESPEGLVIGAVSYREDARDILLVRKEVLQADRNLGLQANAVVGTSSARRKAQIGELTNNDIVIKDIRGNVPTRIQKLRDGEFDAIILAKAGVDRLKIELSEFKVFVLHPSEFVPAPAQGVLAFQCREEDVETRKILAKIHVGEVADCTNIERKVLNMMDGGCQLPLGVYVHKDNNGNYHAVAAYSGEEGKPLTKVSISQSTHHKLAESLYNKLINK